jgi:hypothetical protein
MKKALLIVALAIGGSGCNTSATTGTTGGMTTHVNGTYWASTQLPGITGGTFAVREPSQNRLTITGGKVELSGHTETIVLVLLQLGVRTDTLGLLGNTATYNRGTTASDNYVTLAGNSGTVTITKYDEANKRVSGTFQFKASQASNPLNTISMTSGTFTDVKWRDETIGSVSSNE